MGSKRVLELSYVPDKRPEKTGMSMPPTPTPSHNPQPEFTHAIQYINRIKTRFADEPETYKQFLEILQMYQKEQRVLQDVYDQVTRLFRNAPDLIDEFKMFLPDTNATSPPSMLTLGAGMSAGVRKTAPDDTPKEGPPTKKRRSAPDKDLAVSAVQHTLLHTHSTISPHPHTLTHVPVPPHPHTLHMVHGAVLAHPPHPLHLAHGGQPPSHPPPVQSLPPPPEIFFDRLKRALDDRDSWEDFLKLLTMYSMDVLDESLLLRMATPFLGGIGSELEVMFRELMCVGVDGKRREDTNNGSGFVANAVNGVELPRVPGHSHGFGASGSTGATAGMGSVYLTGNKYRFGSYRQLPESETTLACSGRDELCRSVLNDEWVSHPTWASEDSGFVAHKKNTYEEAMHKSEEERHEYHVQLEAMAYTISLLEPISLKISNMSPEERSTFRLGPSFGGRSKSIHQKIIKKVYNRENASEVLQALQDNPAIAVPVVLERLKLVDSEWKKNKREWEKVWREVDARNFYKSLDHQGVSFKVNDKKTITGKALLAEIERIKAAQDSDRDGREEQEGGGGQYTRLRTLTSVQRRYQLQYSIFDPLVLQDAIKLTLYFLERNDSRQGGGPSVLQYNAIERRRIEAFLRHYVKFQFDFSQNYTPVENTNSTDGSPGETFLADGNMMAKEAKNVTITAAEFDHAFGPPIGKEEWEELGLYVPDATGNINGPGSDKESIAAVAVRGDESPILRGSTQHTRAADDGDLDDIWIRHVKIELSQDEPVAMAVTEDAEGPQSQFKRELKHRQKKFASFFCNTNFYTLIRMLQLLYSRLLTCKELAAKLATEGSSTFLPNPIAFGLGLTDVAGPLAYFGDLASMTAGNRTSSSSLSIPNESTNASLSPAGDLGRGQNLHLNPILNPAEHFYNHLLDLVEKMFDGELEQTTFEENMRFMFGTRAFVVFTLDKLCGAICKQVQAVVQDSRCHELMNMFEQQRGREVTVDEDGNVQDTVRYRRQAEALVGSDENLFRVDWEPEKRRLRIQLLDLDDLSLDPPDPNICRRYYLPNTISASMPAAPTELATTTPDKINAKMTLGWKQYVDSYVLIYPTERRRLGAGRKILLRRTLLDDNCEELNDSQWVTDTRSGMEIMIGPGTCKLYYTRGCEEAGWRVNIRKVQSTSTGAEKSGVGGGSAKSRTNGKKRRAPSNEEVEAETMADEWERLKERAEIRKRERRRWLIDKGF